MDRSVIPTLTKKNKRDDASTTQEEQQAAGNSRIDGQHERSTRASVADIADQTQGRLRQQRQRASENTFDLWQRI